MPQTKRGALLIAAKKAGVTPEQYKRLVAGGMKWCTGAKKKAAMYANQGRLRNGSKNGNFLDELNLVTYPGPGEDRCGADCPAEGVHIAGPVRVCWARCRSSKKRIPVCLFAVPKEYQLTKKVTDHIVEHDATNQLTISVLDEPGQGGACHEYHIDWLTDGGMNDTKPNFVRISFQNGPIKEFGVNGVTQEVLLAVVIDRLRSFQAGPFSCRDNAIALTHCEEALMWLQRRTRERIRRGVEGTNQK